MSSRYRKLLISGFVLVALIAVAAGAFVRILTDKLHTTPGEIVFQRPFGGRDIVTILVLGEDETFSKDPSVRARTDTIMVGAIDLKNKRTRAISIPRDSRVEIPGREGFYKINAAYAFGGPELTAQCVANLLGVPIDYYIKTNIEGLKKVVDILGGVEIDVEKNMHYVDRRGGLYIDLKKGYRHLNGDKALQYVRFRHDRLADLWRVERQQKFMRALARRMTAPENWTKLPQSIDAIMQNVSTNMTGKDLLSLARLSKDIPPDQLKTATLPGTTGNVKHASYFLPDDKAIRPLVDEMLKFQEPKPVVVVLNGSGVVGAAERLAEVLRGEGYMVTKTANAKRMDYAESMVMAIDPTNASVRAIADMLNCNPKAMESTMQVKGAAAVIIVGRNYL